MNRQSITREEALIAHTRNNAFIVFQEANLGSIQNGKYADLLVLDRDYLKVPADRIKDIKPLMTMVGGRLFMKRKSERVNRRTGKNRSLTAITRLSNSIRIDYFFPRPWRPWR